MSFHLILSSWLPVVAWAGLIYHFSGIPNLSTGWGIWDFILRKGAHVTEYAVLTFLLIRAFRKTGSPFSLKKIIIWSGLFAFFYAISDEFHQSFVPGRGPSIGDVLIDSCGMGFALWFYYFKMNRGDGHEAS